MRPLESQREEVTPMYQIYSLLGLLALFVAIAIWASIPEEQEDQRH